ncbi:MAG TPA: DUF4384 domain-containing protein [Gemmatimonadales bacterium]|nr:DUF4384 domain-containing protein [Gemmatimonadales bacterium]
MLPALALAIATLKAPVVPVPVVPPAELIARWVRGTADDAPRISVWLDRQDVYSRGDRARVYFTATQDAYVTVLRIDTDGRLRVLFPRDPWEENFARGGRTFEVLGRDNDEAFYVDDYPGVGYVFAIASRDQFDYNDIVRGDHWDYRAISDGRVRGDPYVTVSDLADRIAQDGDYDFDVAEYDVEQHYDYPRFVCYECHTYVSWRYWDPYATHCSRFRIVIYDDWYYYPHRYRTGGPMARPFHPGPRYVFKDADPRNDYISRVAERPRAGPGGDRRAPSGDRTSADVGGRGTIPAPVAPRARPPGGPDRRVMPEQRRPVQGEPAPQPSPGRQEAPRPPDSPRRQTGEERPRPPEQAPRAGGQAGAPREEPARREPRGESPPAAAPQPRAEPRHEAPPPRSTGEPRLTRRRP